MRYLKLVSECIKTEVQKFLGNNKCIPSYNRTEGRIKAEEIGSLLLSVNYTVKG